MNAKKALSVVFILVMTLLLSGCTSRVSWSNKDQAKNDEIYADETRRDFLSLVAQILARDDLTDITFITKIFGLEVVETKSEVFNYQRDGNDLSRNTQTTILKKRQQAALPGLEDEMLVSVSTFTYQEFKRGYLSGRMNPDKQCIKLDDLYSFFSGMIRLRVSTEQPMRLAYIYTRKEENWIVFASVFDEKKCLSGFSFTQNYEKNNGW